MMGQAPAMPDAAIHTTGEIRERCSDVLYRVALPNGKQILAHLDRSLRGKALDWAVGDCLLLEMTPYDFDGARILGSMESGALSPE